MKRKPPGKSQPVPACEGRGKSGKKKHYKSKVKKFVTKRRTKDPDQVHEAPNVS